MLCERDSRVLLLPRCCVRCQTRQPPLLRRVSPLSCLSLALPPPSLLLHTPYQHPHSSSSPPYLLLLLRFCPSAFATAAAASQVDAEIAGTSAWARVADDEALVHQRLHNTVAVRARATPGAAGAVKALLRMHVTYFDVEVQSASIGTQAGGGGEEGARSSKKQSQVAEGEAWFVDVELHLGVAQEML